MFWIALSAFIMSMTGTGDDTYVIRKFIERTHAALSDQVHDPARYRAATDTLDRTAEAFERHRKRAGRISACIEKLDRSYAVTEQEYDRCLVDVEPAWDAAAEDLIVLERQFRESLTAEELAAVRRAAEPR